MRKFIYYSIIFINIVSIIFGIFNLSYAYDERIFFPVLILIIFSIFAILKKINIIELEINSKKLFLAIFLCITFLAILPINSCLNKLQYFNDIIYINLIFKVIFLISIIFSLIIIFLLLFSLNCAHTNDYKSMEKTRKTIILIITIISIIFISSTYTGFYDCDFSSVWQTGRQPLSNWHTFSFAFLVFFSRIIFNNPYIIIIIQCCLYIYFCNYALKIIERETKNKNLLWLFFIINIFTIVGFDQLRYLMKDTLFSLGFCCLIVTMFDYFTTKKMTRQILIKLSIFSIITLLFRHGASLIIIFLFIILFVFEFIRKRYWNLLYISIPIILAFGIYNIINFIGFNILEAFNYPKNVIYTVPIYQVGAFANDGYDFSDAQKEYLEQYLPIEYMSNNFVKYNGDALARIYDPLYIDNIKNFQYSGLIKINYQLFIERPIFYLKSLLDLTNILWKIEIDDYEWYTYFYKYNWELEDLYKEVTIQQEPTFINKIVDPIVDIGLKSILFNIRARGAFPMFMIVLSMFIFIYKKKYIYIIPILLIFVWYIGLFLSLPMGIVRYCLPFINIYPFIFCLSITSFD